MTGPKQVSLTLCDMWGTEDAPTIWSAVMGKLEEGRSESVALDRNFRPSRAGLSRGVSASAALVVLRAEQAAAEDVSRYVEIISALHELG